MDCSRVLLLQKYGCVALAHWKCESFCVVITLWSGQKLHLAIDRNTNYWFVNVVLLKSYGILFLSHVYIKLLPPLSVGSSSSSVYWGLRDDFVMWFYRCSANIIDIQNWRCCTIHWRHTQLWSIGGHYIRCQWVLSCKSVWNFLYRLLRWFPGHIPPYSVLVIRIWIRVC